MATAIISEVIAGTHTPAPVSTPVAPAPTAPNFECQRNQVLLQAFWECESAHRQASGIESERVYAPISPIDPAFQSTHADSDAGAAARFVEWMGANVLYCPDHPLDSGAGAWIVYHPTRGWIVDTLGAITRLVVLFVNRCISPESFVDRRFAEKLGSVSSINNILSIVKSQRKVDYESLNQDKYKLALLNCVIDLRTGLTEAFCKNEIITSRCNISYNPEAKCTAIRKAFENKWEADDQDTIFMYLASCLNGDNQDRQLLYLCGKGGNGKTTVTKALWSILGSYATQVSVDLYCTTSKAADVEREMAKLKGKRFVFAPECDSYRSISGSQIKTLTGGEAIQSRVLYSNSTLTRSTTKHCIYGNSKPSLDAADKAAWNRIILVQATEGTDKANEDRSISQDAMKECELQGFLNLLLEYHKKWVENGYRMKISERIDAAREVYRAEEDNIGQFIEDHCVVDKEERIECSMLYREYVETASAAGERNIPSAKRFGLSMKEDFTKTKIRGKWYWLGLRVKPE
jgi:P4 family phage/plasmid primase-like protien